MTVLTTVKPSNPKTVRLALTRLAVVPAPPAQPIAHPFSHDEPRARCPACELREYLED
jgi:hypothetical protein